MFPFSFKKKKDPIQKSRLPKMRTKVLPGPQSAKLAESLKRFECPQVTLIRGPFPVFMKCASACNLTDVDGNRYLDLTASFGVASLGYDSPAVGAAIKEQSRRMIHGLGDVHPNDVKVELAKRLSEITPGNLNQTIFSTTGSEAVESALKTAVMATKKTGVIAFTNAYHGLGYGALNVTHREDFRKPFSKQLGGFSYFVPFPDVRLYGNKASETSLKAVRSAIKKNRRSRHPAGAVILEPVQGRGGIMVCPPDFLKGLRVVCDEEKILMIADEVFTGFARTGSMFAVDKSGIVPDLLCLGKAMGNGFPISACIGSNRVMHAWGPSNGEAIHTSTFLGNPLGAAVALSVIREIEEKKFADRAKDLGDLFRKELWRLKEKYPLIGDVRGSGLMIGLELVLADMSGSKKKQIIPATEKAGQFAGECLRRGILVLVAGADRNVISLTPPLIISAREIEFCIKIFDEIFKKL